MAHPATTLTERSVATFSRTRRISLMGVGCLAGLWFVITEFALA